MPTVNSLALEILQDMEKATDDTGAVARTEARVNNALDEIAVATNWNTFKARTTIPTVASQAQYNLPAGAREIITLRYLDTGEEIRRFTEQEAARRNMKLEDTGRARGWIEDGTVESGGNILLRFRLEPVPASIVNFEAYYYYHPSNVASSSTMPVQDHYLHLIKDYVKARLLEIDGKYDQAGLCQGRFVTNLETLRKKELGKVASLLVLKQTDLINIPKRNGPIFDPSHFDNPGF